MTLFGSSGIRGLVTDEVTPDFLARVAAAVGTTVDGDRVVVGRDSRRSGPMLANAVSSGFQWVGMDVDRVGVVPTPALQHYAKDRGVPAAMVTASHNPPPYNGVKLFDERGIELTRPKLNTVEAIVKTEEIEPVSWKATGQERQVDAVSEEYVSAIGEAISREPIEESDLTVAVDPGHGAASDTTGRVCADLGTRVVSINDIPDGHFPNRNPEPTSASLDGLSALVRASGADIGIAHDGDGDRAVFVDETGDVVSGDTMLAILAAEFVEPDDVVVAAVNVSQRLVEAVEMTGGHLELTAIGSAKIVERIEELNSQGERVVLAGEGNGGIFLPQYALARDGGYVAGRVLELITERSLRERADRWQGYHLVRESVSFDGETERNRMESVLDRRAETTDATVDRTDGVRLSFKDGWVLARESGTEPLFRVVGESSKQGVVQSRIDSLVDDLQTAREEVSN